MLTHDNQYLSIINNIKERIFTAQHSAMMAVNNELVMLYWQIGTIINSHNE